MIRHLEQGTSLQDRKLAELVVGFDMVNEEDFTPEISFFAEGILEGKQRVKILHAEKDGMPCFFHAGETHDRKVKNLHDAILLGTKRIGHGFQLQLFPTLQQQVKEKDICIEVCPLSNMVLGYTKDLRSHPVRFLLQKGV